MTTQTLTQSSAAIRFVARIVCWWRDWSAVQDEAARYAFARHIDPTTGRTITSTKLSRYY